MVENVLAKLAFSNALENKLEVLALIVNTFNNFVFIFGINKRLIDKWIKQAGINNSPNQLKPNLIINIAHIKSSNTGVAMWLKRKPKNPRASVFLLSKWLSSQDFFLFLVLNSSLT